MTKTHSHAPWGFATDSEGRRVRATSLESQYPKKMCVVLSSIVLQVAADRGLKLKAMDLSEAQNPLMSAVSAQMGSDVQPKPSKIPPIVPDFSSVAVFLADDVSDAPMRSYVKIEKFHSTFLPCWDSTRCPSQLKAPTCACQS